MEELALTLGIIYTFVVGYFFARKADCFMRKHPRAFPGKRRIIVVPPVWHDGSYADPEAFHKPCNEEKPNHETGDS